MAAAIDCAGVGAEPVGGGGGGGLPLPPTSNILLFGGPLGGKGGRGGAVFDGLGGGKLGAGGTRLGVALYLYGSYSSLASESCLLCVGGEGAEPGGGGGGGAAGDVEVEVLEKAFRAAWAARLGPFELFVGGREGGGGGVDRTGGRGADPGGGGGAVGGIGESCGGVGARPDGLRDAGGGKGGFLPIGGAGFGFPARLKEENEAVEFGLSDCDRRLFRNAATPGAGGADPGGNGGAEPGIRGGAFIGFKVDPPIGGRGAELRDVSGSD
jgi:hypothetical protein